MITEIKKGTPDWRTLFGQDDPEIKNEISEPAEVVYIKGDASILLSPIERNKSPRIAIIGTNDPDNYGEMMIRQIINTLSQRDDKPIIVSNLAMGIGMKAHNAAINTDLPTIAVLPTGMDKIYPSNLGKQADKIANTPGCCLISQFNEKTEFSPLLCVYRNRTIAEIVDGLIVVESKIKGSAMVTARLAYEKAVPVFAVPGRIDDINSRGCNMLIRTRKADILTDIDMLRTWQWSPCI